MTAYLDRCHNIFGNLAPDLRRRLEAVIENPNHETWDNAYSICISGFTTLWQAVIAIDPTFPRTGPVEDRAGHRLKGWERVPDQLTLYRALRAKAGVS